MAGVGINLRDGLRKLGIKACASTASVNYTQDGFTYDYVLKRQNVSIKKPLSFIKEMAKQLTFFIKIACAHDTFVFISTGSLLPRNLDLPILEILGKKTVFWFMGSDVRNYELLKKAAAQAGIKYVTSKDKDFSREKKRVREKTLRRIERFAGDIICLPSIAHALKREYHIIYPPFNDNGVCFNIPNNRKPLVVHAPTDREYKGTEYILRAVKELKKEGLEFAFVLLENLPRNELLKKLTKADIAVDQLFEVNPGVLALEAMASGCVVLGGNLTKFSGFPESLPVVHTDPSNVYNNLKRVIGNAALRTDLAVKGKEYVEKYHSKESTAKRFLEIFKERGELSD